MSPTVADTLAAMSVQSGARLERFVRARWGREQGGMRALTENAGMSADALYKWFRGEAEPSLESLGGLAKALGVRRYELVAVLDGDQAPVDLRELLDPALRASLVELIAEEVERRRGD